MKTSNWNIRFESSANQALAGIKSSDAELSYTILNRINYLKADPFPHYFGEIISNSETVKFLEKQGYDIHKLRCSEFDAYRIFYFVDEDKEVIIICEIILRQNDTYSDSAPHIKRIKAAYKKYYNV